MSNKQNKRVLSLPIGQKEKQIVKKRKVIRKISSFEEPETSISASLLNDDTCNMKNAISRGDTDICRIIDLKPKEYGENFSTDFLNTLTTFEPRKQEPYMMQVYVKFDSHIHGTILRSYEFPLYTKVHSLYPRIKEDFGLARQSYGLVSQGIRVSSEAYIKPINQLFMIMMGLKGGMMESDVKIQNPGKRSNDGKKLISPKIITVQKRERAKVQKKAAIRNRMVKLEKEIVVKNIPKSTPEPTPSVGSINAEDLFIGPLNICFNCGLRCKNEVCVECLSLAELKEVDRKIYLDKKISFSFRDTGKYHTLFGDVLLKQGEIPLFAAEFLNCKAATVLTQINMINLIQTLWNTEHCQIYVKSLSSGDIAKFKFMCKAYFCTLHSDDRFNSVAEAYRSEQIGKRKVREAMMNDRDFGLTFDNVTRFLRDNVSTWIIDKAKKFVTAFETSSVCLKMNSMDRKIDSKINSMSVNNFLIIDDDLVEVKEEEEGNLSILTFAPIFSAYAEEILKCIPYMANIIGKLDDWVHGSKWRRKWHLNSISKTFWKRLEEHILNNSRGYDVTNVTVISDVYTEWTKFPSSYEQVDYFVEQPLKHGFTMPSRVLPLLNEEQRSVYPYPNIDEPEHANQLLKEKKFFPMLWGVTPYFMYDDTPENLIATCYFRLCTDIPPNVGNGVWSPIIESLPQLNGFDFKPDHDKWFADLLPLQKGRIQKYIDSEIEGDILDKRTKVFLKSNELLAKGYGRLIFFVSPFFFLKLGDFIKQFSKFLAKEYFSHVPKFIISDILACCYPCGLMASEMDVFVNHAISSSYSKFGLFSGDDTAIIDRDTNEYIENDFSKYDSTQMLNQALEILPVLIDKSGHSEMSSVYREMYDQEIVWKHTKTNISFSMPWSKPPWRMSGEPGTSCGNTCVNIFVTKRVLETCKDSSLYAMEYASYGFKAKVKIHHFLHQMTFLKGVWLFDVKGIARWIRLPSFLLKFGKMLSDPNLIGLKKMSINAKYQQCLWSQWLGYGDMTSNWFYKSFGEILRRLCPSATNIAKKEEYHVFSDSKFEIPYEEFNSMMKQRYDVCVNDMETYLINVSGILSIPSLYQDPFLKKIFLVDG